MLPVVVGVNGIAVPLTLSLDGQSAFGLFFTKDIPLPAGRVGLAIIFKQRSCEPLEIRPLR